MNGAGHHGRAVVRLAVGLGVLAFVRPYQEYQQANGDNDSDATNRDACYPAAAETMRDGRGRCRGRGRGDLGRGI